MSCYVPQQKSAANSLPPITLLQIVPPLVSGGIARATLDTAQAVVAAGGRAIVASPGGAMLPDLLRLRATHIDLPEWGSPLAARLSLPARLTANVRHAGVNIIQSRSPVAGWVAASLARRLKVKYIATLHRPFGAAGFMERRAEHRQLQADAVIAISDHVARDVCAHAPGATDRLYTISPGINLDRFDPAQVHTDRFVQLAGDLRVPDGSHMVLCPARFDRDRGQKLLVDAIKRLGRDNVFCLLLGSTGAPTAFEKEVEQAIVRAGLHGRVQIGPYVEDMPAAYMLADVVVALGGKAQGFSRPLFEAQAMGRPVVAEDGGAAAEAFVPGVTGWLSAPHDAAALAGALDTALSLSTERRGELAVTAREHVRSRYGLPEANRQQLELFQLITA
jgi:glycosyltransferase involved in cell wall biosynthesis